MSLPIGPVIRRNVYQNAVVDQGYYSVDELFSLPATPDEYNLEVSVKAVVELVVMTGGTIHFAPYVYKGGSSNPADNRAAVILTIGTDFYTLNRLAAPPGDYPASPRGCSELHYKFNVLAVPGSDNIQLNYSGALDLKAWEPRDPTTRDWLSYKDAGQDEVVQYCFVRLRLTNPKANSGITQFRFSGFMDNIRQSGSR